MKKRYLALLCALGLLLCLALPAAGSGSASQVYILAVNDKFCDLPGGALPVVVNGTVYVPYTVFDKSATGVDLGVYYGLGIDRYITITLYSPTKLLIFTVNRGICTDKEGNTMSFRAVVRNAVPYVPAAAVCEFFGLNYSFLPTTNRGTLIRISSAAATMTDSQFLSAGSQAMTTRYNSILQSMDPTDLPEVTPTPPAATPTPGGEKGDVRVYLAVDASTADEALLSAFPPGVQVLLLFSPDALPAQSALARKAVAAGHSVGLTVSGTLEEALEALERGNELLTHITRSRTRMALAPEELREPLTAAGWACWQSNVTGEDAYSILSGVELKRVVAQVQLPAAPAVAGRVVEQLLEAGYDLRQPLETEL